MDFFKKIIKSTYQKVVSDKKLLGFCIITALLFIFATLILGIRYVATVLVLILLYVLFVYQSENASPLIFKKDESTNDDETNQSNTENKKRKNK